MALSSEPIEDKWFDELLQEGKKWNGVDELYTERRVAPKLREMIFDLSDVGGRQTSMQQSTADATSVGGFFPSNEKETKLIVPKNVSSIYTHGNRVEFVEMNLLAENGVTVTEHPLNDTEKENEEHNDFIDKEIEKEERNKISKKGADKTSERRIGKSSSTDEIPLVRVGNASYEERTSIVLESSYVKGVELPLATMTSLPAEGNLKEETRKEDKEIEGRLEKEEDLDRLIETPLGYGEYYDFCFWCFATNVVRDCAYFYGPIYRAFVDPKFDPTSTYKSVSGWMYVCAWCGHMNTSTTRKELPLPKNAKLDDVGCWGLKTEPFSILKGNSLVYEDDHEGGTKESRTTSQDGRVNSKEAMRTVCVSAYLSNRMDLTEMKRKAFKAVNMVTFTSFQTNEKEVFRVVHPPKVPSNRNSSNNKSNGSSDLSSRKPTGHPSEPYRVVSLQSLTGIRLRDYRPKPLLELTRLELSIHAYFCRKHVRVSHNLHLAFEDRCGYCDFKGLFPVACYRWLSESEVLGGYGDPVLKKCWTFVCPKCNYKCLSAVRSKEKGPFGQEPGAFQINKSLFKSLLK